MLVTSTISSIKKRKAPIPITQISICRPFLAITEAMFALCYIEEVLNFVITDENTRTHTRTHTHKHTHCSYPSIVAALVAVHRELTEHAEINIKYTFFLFLFFF
jgi:hypothetical protein